MFVAKILTFANSPSEMDSKMEYSLLLKKISKFCVSRERSSHEVEEKLKSWSVEEEDINSLIHKLKEENLVNEKRYVAALVSDKFRSHHWGKKKIRQHLEYQNINKEIIDQALEEIPEQEYLTAAIKLINDTKNKESLYMKMTARGYEEELIIEILTKMGLIEI